jgi:hypothetical protein
MDLQIVLIACAVLFVICIVMVASHSKEMFQEKLPTRYSKMKPWNKPSNPWDKTAQIMYSLQLPEECQKFLDEYGKNPSEDVYKKLLNCKFPAGERYYLKKLGTVLQSGVL